MGILFSGIIHMTAMLIATGVSVVQLRAAINLVNGLDLVEVRKLWGRSFEALSPSSPGSCSQWEHIEANCFRGRLLFHRFTLAPHVRVPKPAIGPKTAKSLAFPVKSMEIFQ